MNNQRKISDTELMAIKASWKRDNRTDKLKAAFKLEYLYAKHGRWISNEDLLERVENMTSEKEGSHM